MFPVTDNSSSNNINNAVMIIIYCFTYMPDTEPTISLLSTFNEEKIMKLESGSAESLTEVCSMPKLYVLLQL